MNRDDIPALILMGFVAFVYICIGAFFAWLIGMDEFSLAYIGVLFFWPIVGIATWVAAFLAWSLVMMLITGISGVFSR